jgi:hypothetical protein
MLPKASRALLVRMVMRKGDLFRASKLNYAEIGDTRQAASALVACGWVDDQPTLTLEQLFGLLKKPEISQVFHFSRRDGDARKIDQLMALSARAEYATARSFAAWHADSEDCVYRILIMGLCERLRLLFFGNLHQDWSEFVLSDLGIFRYEKVAFSASSRGFLTRRDVEDYLHLHQCRERFQQGEPPADILKDIPAAMSGREWLESKRAKLLFRIAQRLEQLEEWSNALAIYSTCGYPGARMRTVRVLERTGQFEAAFELAAAIAHLAENEAEQQQLTRIVPRLRRKLGLPKIFSGESDATAAEEIELDLRRPQAGFFVEHLVKEHLAQSAAYTRVYYVENTLVNSLFGLLCWNAIFMAVPGAFFHPFHTGPADLSHPDFHRRRAQAFAACLGQLDSDRYKHTIIRTFHEKSGIQSPFVFWETLDQELMELALTCIPGEHLKKWFTRILQDIPSNRTGWPDLIQFWPDEKRYRMIEVKGPGDRLQDNQRRLLAHFAVHDMPAAVCYVRWSGSAN